MSFVLLLQDMFFLFELSSVLVALRLSEALNIEPVGLQPHKALLTVSVTGYFL